MQSTETPSNLLTMIKEAFGHSPNIITSALSAHQTLEVFTSIKLCITHWVAVSYQQHQFINTRGSTCITWWSTCITWGSTCIIILCRILSHHLWTTWNLQVFWKSCTLGYPSECRIKSQSYLFKAGLLYHPEEKTFKISETNILQIFFKYSSNIWQWVIQCDGGKIYLFIAGLLYLRPLIQMKIKSNNNPVAQRIIWALFKIHLKNAALLLTVSNKPKYRADPFPFPSWPMVELAKKGVEERSMVCGNFLYTSQC